MTIANDLKRLGWKKTIYVSAALLGALGCGSPSSRKGGSATTDGGSSSGGDGQGGNGDAGAGSGTGNSSGALASEGGTLDDGGTANNVAGNSTGGTPNPGTLSCASPALAAIGDNPPSTPITVGKPDGVVSSMPAKNRPFLVKAGGKQEALLTGYSESAWLALVPHQSPRDLGFKCPAGGGTTKTWDPKNPDVLSCGGKTFPNPTDGHTTVSVDVLSGKTVAVPVWSVPGGGSAYVQEVIDLNKAFFLYGALDKLASAYVATKDERYARRIALTLNEWAKYVPDYFFTSTNSGTPITVAQAKAQNFNVQRFSDHNGIAHELDAGPIDALDAIYDSPTLAQLATELGSNVKQNIIDDYFMNELDFMLNDPPIEVHTGGNLSFPYVQVARLATVLGRRDFIEWLDSYMERTALNLTREGWFPQSMTYGWDYLTTNRQVVAGMNGFFGVWKASSPEEVSAQQLLSVDDTLLSRGIASATSVALPDGNTPPVGNTSLVYGVTPRTQTMSALMPAYGHAALGNGTGDQQTQVNFDWEDSNNHIEDDLLSFTLFADKSELIGEIRDSRMPGRSFTESTFAHNTVAINRSTQKRGNNQDTGNIGHAFSSGNLLEFEANLNGVSLAEVDGARAYIGTADRYQRLVILDTVDPAHPYVVDFFRVKGGTVHDYFLHGAPRFDEVITPPDSSVPPATSNLNLKAMTGAYPLLEGSEKWLDPPNNDPWYGAFRDVWTAHSSGQFDVTFKERSGQRGTRIFMVDAGDTDVFVAKSPNPFRDQSPVPTDQSALYGYWRPSLMVRRRATTVVDSTFAAVIEPLNGASSIASVQAMPLQTPDPDRIAIKITFTSGREDDVLITLKNSDSTSSADTEQIATQDGTFSLSGRIGIFSKNGGTTRAQLITGDQFVYPGGSVTQAQGAFTGTITSVLRQAKGCTDNAFVTAAVIPAGDTLHGRWIRLNFPTYDVIPDGTKYPFGLKQQTGFTQLYQIDRVVQRDNQTYILLLGDPALAIENGQALERARPFRTFSGPVTFEIGLSKSQ